MRTTTILKLAGTGILALALLALVMTAGTRTAAAEGAAVIRGFECFMFVPELGGLFTQQSHIVNTPSGNTTLICQFTFDRGGAPDRTVHLTGFGCGTDFGSTFNTDFTASPGGTVTLRCEIKHS